jgi:hypothetical protein
LSKFGQLLGGTLLRHGTHSDHRKPQRNDSGKTALLAAVLDLAICDWLRLRVDRPDFHRWATSWARRDVRSKLAAVSEWLFCYRGPGYSVELAAETLGFNAGDFRALLKAERTRRWTTFRDRGPAERPASERSAKASRRSPAISVLARAARPLDPLRTCARR